MCAGFDYFAFFHDDDQIGAADGGEAVGDDDGGFVFGEVGEKKTEVRHCDSDTQKLVLR